MNDRLRVIQELTLPMCADEHIVALRKLVRERATAIKFSLVDQTKLITAASELARNTLKYGGGGEVQIAEVSDGLQQGIRMIFTDQGPGIPDVQQALTDGFTSGGGLGLGLGGSKRLVDEFDLRTKVGEGTVVTIIKWKK